MRQLTAEGKTLRRLAMVVVAFALASGDAASARDRVNWATGVQFQQQLAEPVRILWADNPLRAAVEGLSHARRVAILIDRRVDPGQKLDISLRGVPLWSALQAVAGSRELDVACLGPVVYLGPPAAAGNLDAIAASLEKSVRRLPPASRRKWEQAERMGWDDLATPRELLGTLARRAGLEISGLELVPHDLWAAADLPAMPLANRLALVAVQFDLGVKIADRGQRLELAPFAGAARRRGAAGWRPAVGPAAAATTEPAAPPSSLEETHVDRLSVKEKPLGPVLRQLANRLGFELQIDERAIAAAGISLEQRVSLHVENASVDELLRQLLRSTGLTYHRHGRIVEIVPAG
jgi:hypothetical protein